jgi:hypothetical protein
MILKDDEDVYEKKILDLFWTDPDCMVTHQSHVQTITFQNSESKRAQRCVILLGFHKHSTCHL